MPSLTVKNIPDKVLKRLKEKAKSNHRSLQGEVLYTLEHSAMEAPRAAEGSLWEVVRKAQALGPAGKSSVPLIREDRDGR